MSRVTLLLSWIFLVLAWVSFWFFQNPLMIIGGMALAGIRYLPAANRTRIPIRYCGNLDPFAALFPLGAAIVKLLEDHAPTPLLIISVILTFALFFILALCRDWLRLRIPQGTSIQVEA